MAVNSENQINLKTLQRVDSSIVEIIDNTSQVAIYKYEKKLEQWEGTDVEGTFFLYRRSVPPCHGFIIVNRMNTTNFIESLTSDMQFQLQEPYLLYKNASGDIIGCWFYEHKNLKRICKKIQTIVLKQASAPRRQRCASESDTKENSSGGQDIMTMLSQAHEKYMKNQGQPERTILPNPDSTGPESKSSENCAITNGSPLKSTSQEDYPLSPRRRFMSTGSLDSQQKAAIYWLTETKENHLNNSTELNRTKDITSLLLGSKPVTSADNRFPSKDMPLSLINVAEEPLIRNGFGATGPFLLNQRSLLNQTDLPSKDWRDSENKDAHFTSIKQALKSQVQDNPKVMLQIHEAYISSLRSLFNKQ